MGDRLLSRNSSKSLSGIETWLLSGSDRFGVLGIPLNPYQGLKRLMRSLNVTVPPRNSSKSLSGIETKSAVIAMLGVFLGIPLNPYQGLKLLCPGEVESNHPSEFL